MTPGQAYYHCLKHGGNSELEKIILTDIEYAYRYARDVIRDRWKQAESSIVNDPYFSCLYAINVIKSRWPEAENVIVTSSELAYLYAKHIIKGKLPENMHNVMIAQAITNPNDEYVKQYAKFIS